LLVSLVLFQILPGAPGLIYVLPVFGFLTLGMHAGFAVYFPEWKTVCLGDMMAGTNGVTNPVVDYAHGGRLAAWPSSLDRALAFDVSQVVPGHGPIVGREELVTHRDKLTAIATSLRAWNHDGKKVAQIHDLLVSTYGFKAINLQALDGLIAEFK